MTTNKINVNNNPLIRKPTLFFDMDGTICSLYTVADWEKKLDTFDHSPFIDAKPMFNLSGLCKRLMNLKKKGFKICIVTWLSMTEDDVFNDKVRQAKNIWLEKHFKTFKFDTVYFLPFGTDKDVVANPGDILFDDSDRARAMWSKGPAYSEKQIISILAKLNDYYY